jgi:DNA-binding MarR family transcriptional regulator
MSHNKSAIPLFQGPPAAAILVAMSTLRQRADALPGSAGLADTPTLAPLDDRLGFWLRLAQQAAFDSFHRAMAPLGLTPGRLGALLLLEAHPGLRQSALAEALRVKPSNLAVLLAGLEQDGLIRRDGAAGNRRVNLLRLTQAGRALLKRAKPQEALMEQSLTERLSAEERDALLIALKRIAGG